MKPSIEEYLEKQLRIHHDDDPELEKKRISFYEAKAQAYKAEGREEENIDEQLRKEIRSVIKKRDTPDFGDLRITFNAAFASRRIALREIGTLLFTRDRASLVIFSAIFFLAYFFFLVLLLRKKIRFSIYNLISLVLRSLSLLSTFIQLVPYRTIYRQETFIASYTFPGYLVGTQRLEEGSTATPIVKAAFITDFIIALLLCLLSLFLYLQRRIRIKKDIQRKISRFEEDMED